MLKGNSKGRLIEFYECLPGDEYAQLKSYVHELISGYGSIYLCRKKISKIKYIKSHYRSILTDKLLEMILQIWQATLAFYPN